ncbi:MAG: hypothetical protein WCK34_15660 [Bacteroidota bacterium]
MKNIAAHPYFRVSLSIAAALVLLGLFVLWNDFDHARRLKLSRELGDIHEREHIADTAGASFKRLAFYDFESGNAADTASHLAARGHGGRQSLELSSRVPFSPGLWVRFKDLNPGDSTWIRATGYVWFTCPPAEAKCSLVATCNHKGVNFKYLFIAVEKENFKPGQWNRVTIDYHVPQPPDREDVVQAYFWYRGSGEMLVDDIDIEVVKWQ